MEPAMPGRALKLEQASAVLEVHPKDLQNLVQFGVVKPKRSDGTYLFDLSALLAADLHFASRSIWERPQAS